ncbi:uncharacterized protein LOC144148739 [Haemaphysalis longicornis]
MYVSRTLRPVAWIVALAIPFLFLYIESGKSAEIFNLDVAYERYAKQQAKVHGVKVLWTDCWYNRTEMKTKPLYSPYQITVQAGRFNLGEVTSTVQAPTAVYKHKYINRQKSPIKATFKQSKTLAQTTSTSLINGFECNITGSLTATIKKVVSIGAGFALNFYVHRTNTETNVTTKTIEVDIGITVRPKCEVTVEWQVTNIKKERSWTMDMMASGYCAKYFDRPVKGTNLHFTPIRFLGYTDKRLTVLSSKHPGTVSYTSKGILSSVETYDHNVVITELCNGSSGRTNAMASHKYPTKGKPHKLHKHRDSVR